MKKGPITPKGFRDIGPDLAKKRRETINKIVDVLEDFGFVPIETPTIEFADTLLGKYGNEEKLIYQFKDRGGRKLALRYDLTVPLARFVANNLDLISQGPFRRYQIGQVFRGENPQKGRYREFIQIDFDSVGSEQIEEDALIATTAINIARRLGLKNYQLIINYKPFVEETTKILGIESNKDAVLREIDKKGKKPLEEINKTIVNLGYPPVSGATIAGPINSFQEYSQPGTITKLMDLFQNFQPATGTVINKQELSKELKEAANQPSRKKIFEEPNEFKKLKEKLLKNGVREDEFAFERTLVRGLDYYTGFIFELKPSAKLEDLSIGGGGRYDNLIEMFAGRNIPAVGFSFGLDRLIELI